MKQLKEMHEENKQMKCDKDQIADQNATDVRKLQTDVLYWKSKLVVKKKLTLLVCRFCDNYFF